MVSLNPFGLVGTALVGVVAPHVACAQTLPAT